MGVPRKAISYVVQLPLPHFLHLMSTIYFDYSSQRDRLHPFQLPEFTFTRTLLRLGMRTMRAIHSCCMYTNDRQTYLYFNKPEASLKKVRLESCL